ncbi:MAG: hypothetical protein KJ077_39140 [Anaerolineae bacterium]|nr:hypothetical protein [Anaerolineae bacterium]
MLYVFQGDGPKAMKMTPGWRKEPHTIEHSTQVNTLAPSVWQRITEVDIASFRYPPYFSLFSGAAK